MTLHMGPVLSFRGAENARWLVSALAVISDAGSNPGLVWGATAALDGANRAAGKVIASDPTAGDAGAKVWRFDMAVPMSQSEQQVFYRLDDGSSFSFFVPPADRIPRMAYGSCNGFSDPKLMKKVADPNRLWADMGGKHERQHYHLLLLGGDQVYSDTMWIEVPGLKAWCNLPWTERRSAAFAGMEADMRTFYFQLYIELWSRREPAAMFASIPTIMMWDDHDIFDGWGSYPPEQTACDVYQGIFRAARDAFRTFQLGVAPDEKRPGTLPDQAHLSFAFRVGPAAILALDMRSERTLDQVMSLEAWNAVRDWFRRLDSCKHLLVLSSIPVVHPNLSALEKLLGKYPGQQEMEDDLRDHWNSRTHREERVRLVHRLFDFSAERGCRVTLLSGDVHVGALGVLQTDRSDAPPNARVINQLTSSGIVHPATPGMQLKVLEQIAGHVETLDRGITAQMLNFPGTDSPYIGARNWLSLEPDDQLRIWANWYVEGESHPYTKVVHPV
jgi:hypothetical protein